MIVGCYSTDLYCDFSEASWEHMGSSEYPGPGRGYFTGQTFASTKRQAIAKGWKFHSDGDRVLCPSCVARGRKLPNKEST